MKINFKKYRNEKLTPLQLLGCTLCEIGKEKAENNKIEEANVLINVTLQIKYLVDTYEKEFIEEIVEAIVRDYKADIKKEILDAIKKDFHFIPKVNLN
jgi:hypothetical protein